MKKKLEKTKKQWQYKSCNTLEKGIQQKGMFYGTKKSTILKHLNQLKFIG